MVKIHPSTYSFLKELGKNNSRDWFNQNKGRYSEIRERFIQFLESVYPEMIAIDPELEGIDLRKSVFRIHRDVRFSEDKSPYKTSVAASIIAGGRKNFSDYAGYYIHLEKGNSLVAGGAYMPPSPWISSIRAKISSESGRLDKIIAGDEFVRNFGTLDGEKLKSAPRGYKMDNPDIELLRMKSYLAVRHFTEEEVLSDDFRDAFLECARAIKPLNDFVNEAAGQ